MSANIKPIRVAGGLAYIPLSQNREAIVDLSDLSLVSQYNWIAFKNRNATYVRREVWLGGRRKKAFYLHREILNAPKDMVVDHVNGDGLDNRRANLRLATHLENRRNSRKSSKNTSGMKGVSWHKLRQKWRAQIRTSDGRLHLGLFDTADEAYSAYCDAAKKYHGEFCNFGEDQT